MNFFVRWSTTLGLLGGVMVGSPLVLGVTPVSALPEQQVLQRLSDVPVFAVTDLKGNPLVATFPNQAGSNQKTEQVAGIFLSQKAAQAFVDKLKQDDPEVGKQVQVVPISLAGVYQLSRQQRNQPDSFKFAFVPVSQQVENARLALQQAAPDKAKDFQGVPLFVARAGQDYLTVQQNGQQYIPFFFDREQLDPMVIRFKQQQPNQTISIQVVSLEGVIQTLESKDDPKLNQILLVPSRESLEFLRSQSSTPNAAPVQPGSTQPK